MIRPTSLLGLALATLALGCATLATPAGDDDAVRPNAGAGPFRPATSEEVSDSDAPTVIDPGGATRAVSDPGALDLDRTSSIGRVAVYGVTTVGGVQGIYRYLADDGRHFHGPDPAAAVLVASESWEGTTLSGPDVHWNGDEVVMYYAGEGGIGVARSADGGVTFAKSAAPLLVAGGEAWEAGEAPSAPGWVRSPGGTERLFYGAAGRIGEATSSDGLTFTRVNGGPVLEPRAALDFDDEWVGQPFAITATSEEGRALTRVYFAGRSSSGEKNVGLAARFDDGPRRLTRATSPVFTSTRLPSAPAIVQYSGVALLYLEQYGGSTASKKHPAVALGVAPGDVHLPPLPDGAAP